ncbi:hypothetical protein LINPERPRIM_LOCUS15820 [Linum perenne]
MNWRLVLIRLVFRSVMFCIGPSTTLLGGRKLELFLFNS